MRLKPVVFPHNRFSFSQEMRQMDMASLVRLSALDSCILSVSIVNENMQFLPIS